MEEGLLFDRLYDSSFLSRQSSSLPSVDVLFHEYIANVQRGDPVVSIVGGEPAGSGFVGSGVGWLSKVNVAMAHRIGSRRSVRLPFRNAGPGIRLCTGGATKKIELDGNTKASVPSVAVEPGATRLVGMRKVEVQVECCG